MADVLAKINEQKQAEIAALKQRYSLADLSELALEASTPRGFTSALASAQKTGYGLIAELKKASPSKGLIRPEFVPAELAAAYAAGGATCLSVLTDQNWFQGHEAYLRAARAACDLPVLRKDFMLDPYQIYESRAMGADCILLIMASLDDGQAAELEAVAIDLGMDVLVEVHNEDELTRAARLKSPLLGINNRDLHTFKTDLEVTKTLSRIAPENKVIVSESGLNSPEDLADIARYGARCFLIGESLMRQNDVAQATRALLANPLTSAGAGL